MTRRAYRFAAAALPLLFLGCLSTAPAPRTRAAAASPAATEAMATAWLEAHRDRPAALRAFLQRMPKGGDIHSHLSGAVYAESYLAWAEEDGFCLDRASRSLTPPPCDAAAGRPILADTIADANAFSALVDRMSVRNLESAGRSGRDQFFSAFGAFRAIKARRRPDMVAEVVSQAASQHVSYLELARNSLTYSFLPGESLWRDPAVPEAVAACAGEAPGAQRPSPGCREFLDGSERAREQWRLEGEFRLFEREAQRP